MSAKVKLAIFAAALFFCLVDRSNSDPMVPTLAPPIGIGSITLASYVGTCDGITDVSAKVQAAVNAAAGVTTFLIPNIGTCVVASQISVPSNSHITINGTIKLANNVNTNVFLIANSASNIVFDGFGTIDGNRANQTTGSGGINSSAATNIVVRDLTIQNTYHWPVNIVGTTHCLLQNVKMINAGAAPEFAGGSNDCWASNIYVSGIADESFAFYGGVFNSGIIGSTLVSGSFDGISVFSDASQPAQNHDISIVGNTVNGMQLSGVSINNHGGSGPSYNVVISSNVLTGNAQGNTGNAGGVSISTANNVLIEGNNISKDGNGNVGAAGITIGGTNLEINVKHNTILDEGQGGTNGVGITLSTGCSNCNYTDNTILDDQGTPTTAFGFNGNPGPANYFSNNALSGTIGTPYNVTFAADSQGFIIPPQCSHVIAMTNAGSYTAANFSDCSLILTGSVTSYTVTMPPAPPNLQNLQIICPSSISTFTVSANTGQTIVGAPTSCSANSAMAWVYRGSAKIWTRSQ